MSEHQEKFARLLALSALREAQIKANPIPFLNTVAEENRRLREAINEALFTLSGADSMDIAMDAFPSRSPSIVETCVLRNQRAADALASALK